MKLISWNVNGFRAVMKKGFEDFFNQANADIIGLQEIKALPEQIEFNPAGYHRYINSAERKGYSGTTVFTKVEPIRVIYGIRGKHINEGRVIACEYENFIFVTAYVPNSKSELARIDYRMEFEDDMRDYLMRLDSYKPVIYCGDLNVAKEDIDLKNPDTNHFSPGFSDQERNKLSLLLQSGFTDTFRYMYPNSIEYSWWSYIGNSRARNTGWRIDYFLVSNRIANRIRDAKILASVYGSDHCPVELDIDI